MSDSEEQTCLVVESHEAARPRRSQYSSDDDDYPENAATTSTTAAASTEPVGLEPVEAERIMKLVTEKQAANMAQQQEDIPSYLRHFDEDVLSERWARHKKHIFILSNAGKPIFSRYGDESQLNPMMGLLAALVSFVEDQDNDSIRTMIAGKHKFVFLVKGPLYLVAVSCTSEPVNELRSQLEFIHSQIISILTGNITTIFQKRAQFDLRNLMGGTSNLLHSLIHTMSGSLAYAMRCVRCLTLPKVTRQQIGEVLSKNRAPSLLFSLLLAGDRVVQIGRTKKYPLKIEDFLIVMNFVNSSSAFKSSETWTPLCLPGFNSSGFLYAYIDFIAADLCLIMICSDQNDFFKCSTAKSAMIESLIDYQAIEQILESIKSPDYYAAELRVPELRHFVFKSNNNSQFTYPGFAPPYSLASEQKRICRVYENIRDRMHKSHSVHKVYFQATAKETVIGWTSTHSELYAAFSPTTSKETAIHACEKIRKWLKQQDDTIFMNHSPVW